MSTISELWVYGYGIFTHLVPALATILLPSMFSPTTPNYVHMVTATRLDTLFHSINPKFFHRF